MYRASATRASEFGDPALDNTPVIARILQLRHEAARLLGYASYAEVSLVPKMADSPTQVLGFLEDLALRARPHAERDLDELRAFARDALGLERLESWDIGFASERLREQRYAFSDQQVKQYFPEHAVLAGLFRLAERLYGVRIAQASAPAWHDDARFFELRDAASGALVGQFYTDLYARETKRGGAWMDDARARRRRGAELQTPVAYLSCNFARPVGGKPALFTHDDVLTLFHEFGHCLHHLLTRVDELGVSGLAGVEWDAVELPSQFMENFAWTWDVLKDMTRHVDTGEPLPRALYDKMLAAKNFQAGLQMLRQIEFSVFDMRLHYDYDPASRRSALELLQEVRARSPCSCRPSTTGSRTASRTSSPAATRPATTATSGPRCSRRTPTARSRRRPTSPTRAPARAFATRSSPSAAAGPRRSPSAPSAAASRASRRCCGTVV
jgi:oligopeptidase A